jgi:hypothetical protein
VDVLLLLRSRDREGPRRDTGAATRGRGDPCAGLGQGLLGCTKAAAAGSTCTAEWPPAALLAVADQGARAGVARDCGAGCRVTGDAT